MKLNLAFSMLVLERVFGSEAMTSYSTLLDPSLYD